MESSIEKAIKNIAKHGDTDVFPFPIENHVFHDQEKKCKDLLIELHGSFESFFAQYPPTTLEALTQVGYSGFRWATQIEPFWNAYYLALVISLADKIESIRLSTNKESVFSYRYKWNEIESKLFDDSNWSSYRKKSIELSNKYEYVIVTDIADFYSRIYHHRIENALRRLPEVGETPKRIMDLLFKFSGNVSYGLPIGGPASRILSELSLNSIDLHLDRRGIKFCRYADDYCIFCNSKSEAYKLLVLLSEKLHNEGLSLQKKKTKILTAQEFKQTNNLLDTTAENTSIATEEQKLLNISLRYDPYSDTADEDYEALKSAISEVDILGILGREVSKTQIDTTVTKQAIKAIQALDNSEKKYGAIRTLLEHNNILVLSPVFVTLMRAIRGIYDDMPEKGKEFIDESLILLYEKDSHLLSIDLNICYFIQALAKKPTQRKEEILVEIFDKTSKPLIKRLIILVMANWDCHYWLSDMKQHYGGFTEWEKRSFIISSYVLGDEGKHWRNHTKNSWNPMEIVIRDWFADRFQKNQRVPV
ncbi:MAG: hypothetical protein RLZZ422_2428 [Pseudomonadota bacterium]|jgi:hypothetical protein